MKPDNQSNRLIWIKSFMWRNNGKIMLKKKMQPDNGLPQIYIKPVKMFM